MRRGNLERDSEAAQPFMLKLRGKRYITASEVREGSAVDGAVVKALTGGDKITVRGLHTKPVNFVTEGVIVVRCNHRPQIDTTDLAMWDRVVEIPFNYRVPEKEQDGNLKARLRAELSGILNWALAGLQRFYRRDRLVVPKSVQRQTASYKAAMDSINQFAKGCLRRKPKAAVSRSYVYEQYERWCVARSRPGIEVEPKTRQEFYEGMRAIGYQSKKRDGTRFFMNVAVIE